MRRDREIKRRYVEMGRNMEIRRKMGR